MGRGRGSRGSISIHAPSRERRSYQVITINFNNFNPRSLTGATYLRYDKDTDRLISIHAPSRERPASKPPTTPFAIISIHAPSRERPRRIATDCRPSNFNPRSLTGATVHSLHVVCSQTFQSTLPHGSDRDQSQHRQCKSHFNPRSLTGATTVTSSASASCSAFQSTLPHGSDFTLTLASLAIIWNFNPRSLTGATTVALSRGIIISDFNPRSLTGATNLAGLQRCVFLFQSTLPHGSDLIVTKPSLKISSISIHAPSRERQIVTSCQRRDFPFQSTLPHGSDACAA